MNRACGLILLAWFLAGCATVPTAPPVPIVPPAPSVPVLSAWVVTDSWDSFASGQLWPQEWALRHWHAWKLDRGHLNLTPLSAVGTVPRSTHQLVDVESRIWKVTFAASSIPATLGPPGSISETLFTAEETGGLPPSLFALRRLLGAGPHLSGEVRVTEVLLESGRFRVRASLR